MKNCYRVDSNLTNTKYFKTRKQAMVFIKSLFEVGCEIVSLYWIGNSGNFVKTKYFSKIDFENA